MQIFTRFLQSAIASALNAITVDHEDNNQLVVGRMIAPKLMAAFDAATAAETSVSTAAATPTTTITLSAQLDQPLVRYAI